MANPTRSSSYVDANRISHGATNSHQRVRRCAQLAFLASCLLFYSAKSFALGLGTLEITSNLDQPLTGTIELRVSPGDDLDTLTAVIAPRSDFESLGIDYPSYLSDISVLVDQLGATPVLRVTSNDVIIKEPFIHFLVRVEWSGGSFLREYTALVDPPVYAAETPQAISEPRSVGTDESYIDSPASVDPEPSPQISDIDEPVEDVVNEDVINDEPVTEDNTFIDREDSSDALNTSTGLNEDEARYGPVVRGESLSLIAQELQRQFPDLSIYQIMKVLFEENPGSFIDNNINGLIEGALLTVGDLNAIRATDISEARSFFREQLSAWDPSVLNSGSDAGISVNDDNYNFGSGFDEDTEQDAVVSTEAAENFQVGSSSEVSNLVNADQDGNRNGEVLALRDEISRLETSLASSELENQEFSERISILEGQLADMNRLLELGVENADLAQVESTLAEQNAAEAAEGDDLDALLADVTGGAEEVAQDSDAAIEEFLSSGETALDDAVESVDGSLSADGSLLDDGTLLDDDSLAADGSLTADGSLLADGPLLADGSSDLDESDDALLDELADSEEALTPVPDTATVNETPVTSQAESKGFIAKIADLVTSSGAWKIVAGVGGVLLAFFALLFIRRRRADEEFEISMLSIESNSQTQDDTDHSSTSAASLSATESANVESVADNPDKETSFLTVYSDSDAVVQADEVDPVAEADVYIAYGRDEQAEEVLLDGVANQPDRLDIKQKLLSLYHKNRNVEGFERVAEELYSGGEVDGDIWQETVQMGQDLSPNNPLFSVFGSDVKIAEDMNSEISVEGDNIDETLTPVESNMETPAATEVDEPSIELSTTSLDDAVEAIAASDKGDDFVDSEAIEALDNDDSIELINFDDAGNESGIELDSLEIEPPAAPEVDENVVQLTAVAEAEEESSVIEIDLDQVAQEEEVDLGAQFDEIEDEDGERDLREVQEVSDLEIDSGYDEARTQYELAKVFVDLGDEDGARRILNELVANDDSDSEVVSDARELLESIS